MSRHTFFFPTQKLVRFSRQIPDYDIKSSPGSVLFLREKEEPLDQWESKVLRDATAPKVLR